jgi:drug/metabolite transporter (DMT)-like permease
VTTVHRAGTPGAPAGLPIVGLLNLLVIYIVWGSTYLAIRIAVREGAGWGPFWLGASRVLTAAALLFAINRIRGVRLRPDRGELWVLAVTGLLLWVGGNGGVNWAEQRIDSGLAALVVGTTPIWVALIESVIDRRAPSLLLSVSLLVGFAGLAVLTLPTTRGGLGGDFVGVATVVVAAVSWGAGVILLNRRPLGFDPVVTSGWQQLFGGVGFVALAGLVGEPTPTPDSGAWLAWSYLVVFGSLIAFTSFVVAVRHLSTAVVMTYSYVNPVIAVILGWLVLSERITTSTITGTVLILAGVFGVFRDRARQAA